MTPTDILSVGALLGYAVVACLYDWRFRRIPNWFTVVYTVACVAGWVQGMLVWSWWGAGVGLVLAGIAGVAGGDLKLVIVLGGLSTPFIIMSACGIAFLLSVVFLVADRIGWCPPRWRVFTWPLSPFLAVPTCVMVLGAVVGW
jgi:Flp pilus assembly protein protease CpaA